MLESPRLTGERTHQLSSEMARPSRAALTDLVADVWVAGRPTEEVAGFPALPTNDNAFKFFAKFSTTVTSWARIATHYP